MFSYKDICIINKKLIDVGIKCKKYDFTLDASDKYKPHF